MMAGAKTPKAIANWWKNREGLESFLERLGVTKGYGPGKSSMYRVLSLVSVEQFEAQVSAKLEEVWGQLVPARETVLEPVAVDGKTLRGSRK